MLQKCFILHATTAYLQHVFNMLKLFARYLQGFYFTRNHGFSGRTGKIWNTNLIQWTTITVRVGSINRSHCTTLSKRCINITVSTCAASTDNIIQVRLHIFGPGRRVPKSHSSCCCSCCYQFSKGPKLPKAFLRRSGVHETLHTHSC